MFCSFTRMNIRFSCAAWVLFAATPTRHFSCASLLFFCCSLLLYLLSSVLLFEFSSSLSSFFCLVFFVHPFVSPVSRPRRELVKREKKEKKAWAKGPIIICPLLMLTFQTGQESKVKSFLFSSLAYSHFTFTSYSWTVFELMTYFTFCSLFLTIERNFYSCVFTLCVTKNDLYDSCVLLPIELCVCVSLSLTEFMLCRFTKFHLFWLSFGTFILFLYLSFNVYKVNHSLSFRLILVLQSMAFLF